jgi:hypothetical protein
MGPIRGAPETSSVIAIWLVVIAIPTTFQAGRDHRARLSLVPIRTSQQAFLRA